MAEHTPGPWEVGEEVDSADKLVYIPIRRGAKRISTTGVYGRNEDGTTAGRVYKDNFGIERHSNIITAEECRANARLIAAAPELLASQTAATWLVWSHYHGAWWGANSSGYYTDIDSAGRYTLEDAIANCKKRSPGEHGIPMEFPVPSPEWLAARAAAIAKATGESQ